MALLKPGGTAALFWNHPFPNRTTDVSNLVNQKVYEKYRPESKPPIEFSEADCSQRCEELVKYGFLMFKQNCTIGFVLLPLMSIFL